MVYLLHFHSRINANHPCRHYIGYADNLEDRLAAHHKGNGARLTQVALERGIEFSCVRVWIGDRDLERVIKSRKEGPALCPVCSPDTWHNRANYSPNWRPGIEVEFSPIEATVTAPADCPF